MIKQKRDENWKIECKVLIRRAMTHSAGVINEKNPTWNEFWSASEFFKQICSDMRIILREVERPCDNCGKPIKGNNHQIYCADRKCFAQRRQQYRKRYRELGMMEY